MWDPGLDPETEKEIPVGQLANFKKVMPFS